MNARRGRLTKLTRGADGRLRPDTDEADIGDVWAQQRRIKLAEAIAEDERKATRYKRKRQVGLVGLAREELSGHVTAIRTELFGERSEHSVQAGRRGVTDSSPNPVKEIEIKISIPKVNFSHLQRKLRTALAATPRPSRKLVTVALCGIFLAGAVLMGLHIVPDYLTAKHSSSSGDTPGSSSAERTPRFATILPEGKQINQLGGWSRVSPADKNPAFGFADTVNGVPITVSEQPLPDSFKSNLSNQMSQLAHQLGLPGPLTINDGIAYLGTSSSGSQSLVCEKKGLLILIRSGATLNPEQWQHYINALR